MSRRAPCGSIYRKRQWVAHVATSAGRRSEEPCAGDRGARLLRERDKHLPLLYVWVVIEQRRRRRLIHCNVTAHPTAAWTRQQLRQALGFDTHYGYLLHDRDSIFSRELDAAVGGLGLRILKTPPRCPMTNGLCERVIGTSGGQTNRDAEVLPSPQGLRLGAYETCAR